MSLHNDINNLSKTIEKNQLLTEKALKDNEKAKNKLYIAKIELLDDLKDELQHYLKYDHNIESAKIRNEIIEALLEYSNTIYNRNYTRAFLLENYEKEAKKAIKQHEIDKKHEKEVQKEREEAEAQKRYQRQLAFNNFIKFLEIILLILASPFLLIIFFVLGICKNIK